MCVFFLTSLVPDVNRPSMKAICHERRTRLRVSLCMHMCVHLWVLPHLQGRWFITDKAWGRGPCQRLLSWKRLLETADLLSVSSSDCWDIELAFSLCFTLCLLSVSLCVLLSLHLVSPTHAFLFHWDDFIFSLHMNKQWLIKTNHFVSLIYVQTTIYNAKMLLASVKWVKLF